MTGYAQGRLGEMRMDHDIIDWLDQQADARRTTRSQVVREALLHAWGESQNQRPAWESDPKRIVVVPSQRFAGWDVIGPTRGVMGRPLERALEAIQEEMENQEELLGIRDDIDLRKPEEWQREDWCTSTIVDPDGWRGGNNNLIPRDWEEPVSRAEFEQRRLRSTTRPKADRYSQGERGRRAPMSIAERIQETFRRCAADILVLPFAFVGSEPGRRQIYRLTGQGVYQVLGLEIRGHLDDVPEVREAVRLGRALTRSLTVDSGPNLLPWDPERTPDTEEVAVGYGNLGAIRSIRCHNGRFHDPNYPHLREAPTITSSSKVTLEIESSEPLMGLAMLHVLPLRDEQAPEMYHDFDSMNRAKTQRKKRSPVASSGEPGKIPEALEDPRRLLLFHREQIERIPFGFEDKMKNGRLTLRADALPDRPVRILGLTICKPHTVPELDDGAFESSLLACTLSLQGGANLLPFFELDDPAIERAVRRFDGDYEREGYPHLRGVPVLMSPNRLTLELEWRLPDRIPTLGDVYVSVLPL